MISIVIPTYNHLDDCLKPCIEGILKYTDLSDIEIVVVANGCTDGTKAYIEHLGSPFRLVWIDDAVGFIKATNAGIRASKGDFILLLNNDTVLLEQGKNAWIKMLMAPFSNPKVGITGAFKDLRMSWDSGKTTFREQYMVFYCAMIRRSVFDEVGLLDEAFGLGYEEDIDFCIRAQRAGYQLIQVPDDIQYDLNLGKDELSVTPNANPRFPLYHKDRMTFGDPSPNRPQSILLQKYAFPPKYSIIIPTYNHLDDCLKPCIESIIQNTYLSNVEVIVVANGCTDGTKEYIRNLGEPFRLYWANEPLGYTRATNLGIHHARGRYVVLLNNDNVILSNNWFEMLEAPFMSDGLVGITGAAKNFHVETKSEFLLFFCVMISWHMIEKIGKLDEIFNPGYGEDIDYCNKIRKAGYKVVQVPNDITLTKIRKEYEHSLLFPIWHKGSVTVSRFEGWEHVVPRNEKILAERYNVTDRKLIKVNLDPSINMGPEYSIPQNPISLPYEQGSVEEIHAHGILDIFDGNMINWIIDEWTKSLSEEGRLYAKINDRTNLTLVKPAFCNGLFKGSNGFKSAIIDNRISQRSLVDIKNFVLCAGSKEPTVFGGTYRGGYCMQQHPDEISQFIFDYKDIKIENYLEIGVCDHGLMRLLCDFIDINNLYSLDLGWQDQNFPNTLKENLDNLKNRGRYELFRGDSHSAAADRWLSRFGKRFDFIFIDGDHTYDGVRKDTLLAMKYAKPGCIFAFHDHACVDEVKRFCDELISGQIPGFSFVKEYISHESTKKGIIVFEYQAVTKEEVKKPKYSIIIPTSNHLDDCLKPCIESIIHNTDLSDAEVIVVANGCTDGTKAYIESLGSPFSLIWMDKPQGYIIPTNEGIKKSRGNFVILLNNDTVILNYGIKNTWIDMLRHPFESDADVGISGPYKLMHNVTEIEYLHFFCVMIKREVFDKIGLLDEIFGYGYSEDADFCQRASLAGFKIRQVPEEREAFDQRTHFPIYHKANITFNDHQDFRPADFKNEKILTQRYSHVDKPIREYKKRCANEGNVSVDIFEHLPTLKKYAALCEHVTEFGVREGNSTWALFAGHPKKMKSYDKMNCPVSEEIMQEASSHRIDFSFEKADTLSISIEETDLLFIDTKHSYEQLLAELQMHSPKVKKYIIMHDTVSFGYESQGGDDWNYYHISGSKGLIAAIDEFLESNRKWKRKEVFENCNGLTVLERVIEETQELPQGWFDSNDINTYMRLASAIPEGGKMVEVGVWKGRSLCSISKVIRSRNIKFGAVDTFKGSINEPHHAEKLRGINLHDEFMKSLSKFEILDSCMFIHDCPSVDAAKKTSNAEFDLVFIDADHSYEAVLSDILAWLPKVKNGGVIAGHDYGFDFGGEVKKAVHEVFGNDVKVDGNIWYVTKNQNVSKIYDCFTFYNEFDLLEMRLNEMNDIVEKFVLVEATLTFQGKPKPLYFHKNKQRFEKFLHKIVHVIVDDFPETQDQWVREHYQRNAIMQGLTDCKDNDTIIISDVDEIPRAEAIKQYKPEFGIMNLGQGFFYYALNCKGPYTWVEPKILPYGMLKISTPETIRHVHGSNTTPVLHNAGWHFSYLGDADAIIKKIESFSHTEFNTPEFKDKNHVLDCIANGKDIFKRFAFEFVDVDESYPDYVRKNLLHFAKKGFIKPRPQQSLPEGWFGDDDQRAYSNLIESLPQNAKIAEVGVWQGKSLCSVNKTIRDRNAMVYAVDNFRGAMSETDIQEVARKIDIREKFERNIINFNLYTNVTVYQGDSAESAKNVQDNSLDLVFIDADHSYEAVKTDILAWLPKVKDGGTISGHDFYYGPGVHRAVLEIFGYNIRADGNIWSAIKGSSPDRPSSPKYSIIIPTYNHLDDCLKPCIESIIQNTYLSNVEVIVVANGCTDGTKAYIESLGRPFRLIWMENAAGYIKPVNAGIKESRGEYIILLNNDTKMTHAAAGNAWIKMLEQPFLDDSKVGIVGPRKAWNSLVNAEYMIFFCVMIKREVFDRVGLLDEDFEDGYHEDIDFSIRASKAGYRMVEVPEDITYNGETYDQDYDKNETRPANFPIIHYGGATFWHIYGDSQNHITKNKDKLLQKHCPDRQRIFDCFMFFNELDVLEIRLNELDDVVDKFILVEAAVTHQGGPKPLYFNENKHRFQKFLHKIEHVIVNDMPTTNDSWVREPFQRNCAMRGLMKCNPRPDDIVILSDVDEIPRASTVRQYKKEMGLTCIKTRLYYYKINYQTPIEWFKLRIFPFSEINGGDLQQFRGSKDYDYKSIMEDGGWHFSFIGDKDHIKEKIEGWAHVEFNNDSIKSDTNISEALNKGKDILGRGIQFTSVEIDDSFPKFVRDNVRLYEEKDFIAKVSKDVNKPKVYDCFSFFNELDLLEIRLNELDPYVDYFVISEMAVTHSGKPKPLYFNENKQRFSKFLHKIIHLSVSDCFDGDVDPWNREHYQRNFIMNGLHKCKDNDIIIVSDLDEIPRGSRIKEYSDKRDWMYFEQHQYNYYLNMSVGVSKVGPGVYSRITTYGNMKRLGLKPTDLRYRDCDFNLDRIADGGWHFSWMGGGNSIVDKLEAWAHQELNIPAYKNANEIEKNIEKEIDAFGRPNAPHTPKLVPLDTTFPDYILKNQPMLVEQKLIKPISERKKVGIVMPYYNDKSFLIRSAVSIVHQTHKDWILFVVDDGSLPENRAKDALAGLDPDRIRIIEKENGGVSSARNKALEMIRLDTSINYVAYCDADDMWDSDYLASQLNHLKDCDLVYSEVRHEFDNGGQAFPFGIANPDEYLGLDFMLDNPFIFISSVVHRARCLSVGPFDGRLDSIEDWDMWIRIAKAGYKIKKNRSACITYVVKTISNMASKRTDQKYALFREKHPLVKSEIGTFV